MTLSVVGVHGDQISEQCPVEGLAGQWATMRNAFISIRHANRTDARIRKLQQTALKNGFLEVRSIFGNKFDRCDRSFLFWMSIFYRFENSDIEYFWITGQVDRSYCLAALYLPSFNVAFELYPYTVTEETISGFESMRQILLPSFVKKSPVVVLGTVHIMHSFWNEVAAIDYALQSGLADHIEIVSRFQSTGPLEGLFPELLGKINSVDWETYHNLNNDYRLFLPLGAYSITKDARRRLLEAAARLLPREIQLRVSEMKAKTVFWLSVKPPLRTCGNQAEVLAAIIAGLAQRYPDARFFLSGACYPWDMDTNPNYDESFRAHVETAVSKSAGIVRDVFALLDAGCRGKVTDLNGIGFLEEVMWGTTADFFFCHGGTMQNKIAWIHNVAGITHSNTAMLNKMRLYYSNNNTSKKCATLADAQIVDDNPSGYTELEINRSDRNYTFVSIDDVIQTLASGYEMTRPSAPLRAFRLLQSMLSSMRKTGNI